MKELIFYDLMWYNYPADKEYFFINGELTENIKYKPLIKKQLSYNLKEYENILNKYKFLYKQIPFVKNIYVCNSLSFKSIHKNSDIDLFIVTETDRMFLAKLFVWLFFKVFKMYWTHEKGKFCTGFWVTDINLDLYPITIYPLDLYLAYWIAHLQPLYSENQETTNNIFQENMWVKQIIPRFNWKPKKILEITFTHGRWIIKKTLETLVWWGWLNSLIWFFWKKRMKKQKKILWEKWKNIIISDNILKFQAPDIRKIVYLQYKTLKNTPIHKDKEEKTLF